jgi:hypothetical protein
MAAQGALYQWNLPLAQMLGIPLIMGIATTAQASGVAGALFAPLIPRNRHPEFSGK